MKRYATIAAAWLLPPFLLLTAGLFEHGFPRQEDLAPVLMIYILLMTPWWVGALIAFRVKASPRGPSNLLREVAFGLIFSTPLIGILATFPHGPFRLWFLALFSMPIWSAFLVWRPDTRVLSLRFTAVVAACALPLLVPIIVPAPPPPYVPYVISSPSDGASF